MIEVIVLGAVPLVLLLVRSGLRRPAVMIAAYAAILPFGSAWSVEVGLPRAFTSPSSLLAVVTVVVFIGHFSIGRLSGVIHLQHAVWLLLVGVASMTVLWSVEPSTTADAVLTLLPLVLLAVLVGVAGVSRRDLTLIEDGIVLGGAIAGAFAILLLITGQLPTTGAGVPRFELPSGGGTAGDANITAAMLLLPLAVALGRAVGPANRARRLLYGVGAILVVVGISLTASRGGIIATLGLMVVLIIHASRGAKLVLAAIPVLVGALILGLAPDLLAEHVGKTHSSGRTNIWGVALRACPDHCAAGSGWGTFAEVHEEVLLSVPDARGRQLGYEAHSIWLGTVVEGGIAGLLLLLLGVALSLKDLAALPPPERAPPLAAIVALVMTGSFLGTLEFKYFWLVIAYASLAVTSASVSAVEPPSPARTHASHAWNRSPRYAAQT